MQMTLGFNCTYFIGYAGVWQKSFDSGITVEVSFSRINLTKWIMWRFLAKWNKYGLIFAMPVFAQPAPKKIREDWRWKKQDNK